MSIRTSVKQMLVRQQDKKYEAELAKLRVTYAQWAAEQEKKIAETVVTEIGERAGLAEFVTTGSRTDSWRKMLWSGSMRIL